MAAMRWITAGGLMVALLAVRGETLPAPREWPSLTVLGILLLGFGNGAVVWAEQTVPSGLTAVLVATSPFWMAGIEAMMPDGERVHSRRLVGLLLGFAGIVFLVWPELRRTGGDRFPIGVAASQIACIGWAIGSSYAKRRHHDENVLASAAYQMLFGGLVLLLASAALGEPARLA